MHRLLVCLVALCAAVSCDGTDGVTEGPAAVTDDASDYVAAVSLDGTSARFHSGDLTAGTSGPEVSLSSPGTVITGGSSRLVVDAGSEVSGLAIGVAGLPGWWELSLQAGRDAGAVHPVLRVAQTAPPGRVRLWVAGVNGIGAGRPVERDVTILGVGTGELQISVSWDLPADLDLHVVEPGGEEIYFLNRLSESGGLLDLDSNRNCDIDGVNNENVTWEDTVAPAGTYSVRVNLWDSCGQNGADEMNNPDGEITATVTVLVDGVELSCAGCTVVLSGPGNNGALGAGVEVFQFSL